MKKAVLVLVVLGAMAASAFGLAACGGSSGDTAATSAAPVASPSASSGGGGAAAGHDTSSPAKALVGHWKDANGSKQYFDGGEWFTVMADGTSLSYKYDVKEDDEAANEVLLTTYRLEGGERTDVQDIRFTFLNADRKQFKYGTGGLTADYVDAQQRP
jgi:hypothetical protein